MLIEIQELLVKDKVNFSEVDGKLKAMEALHTDMKMEGIRTLEQALAILTPEQQKKAKTLFKEATLIRARRMAPMQGKMMGRGGMMCTDTMKRMMGKRKGRFELTDRRTTFLDEICATREETHFKVQNNTFKSKIRL